MMKRLIIFFFLYSCIVGAKGQVNEGIVSFTSITIDTIRGTAVQMPDTIHYTYAFKKGYSKSQFGTDAIYNAIIINETGTIYISIAPRDSFYSQMGRPINNIFDTLINFTDTSQVKYFITQNHKSIAGYFCTQAYMTYMNTNGTEGQTIIIWYTDQIVGNNFIAGASSKSVNLNGLILEYDYPIQNGVTIVSPRSVTLTSILDGEFHPNLTKFRNINNIPSTSSGGN